jgi:hypothetical protein
MKHAGTFTGTYQGASSAGVGPLLVGGFALLVAGSWLWAQIEEHRAAKALADARAAEAAARAARYGAHAETVPGWAVAALVLLTVALVVLITVLFVRRVNHDADAYAALRVPTEPPQSLDGRVVELEARPVRALPEGGYAHNGVDHAHMRMRERVRR